MLVGRPPHRRVRRARHIHNDVALCPFQSASAFSVTRSPQVIALTMFSHPEVLEARRRQLDVASAFTSCCPGIGVRRTPPLKRLDQRRLRSSRPAYPVVFTGCARGIMDTSLVPKLAAPPTVPLRGPPPPLPCFKRVVVGPSQDGGLQVFSSR